MLEADINIKWVSTLSNNPKGNPRMPDRGMTRLIIIYLRIHKTLSLFFLIFFFYF